MAFGLQTYQDGSRREDLLDIISDVSPDDNPLSVLFAQTTATQTLHEWVEDFIARPTTVNAQTEGAAATFSDLTQPARRTNITQIISRTYRVSGTERHVDVAGSSSPLDYQARKQMREWQNAQEFALIQGAVASGDSGSARQMAGLENIITSHYTNRNSGTSLSETEFNDMQFDVANDVGFDDVFDTILVPLRLRQKISTFTAGSTRYVASSEQRLTRPIMVYEADFGTEKILAHKDVTSSAATPGPVMMGIKEDKFRIAYLKGRRPIREMLAKTGDRDNGQIVGELTLEYLAERANARRTGYNQTG